MALGYCPLCELPYGAGHNHPRRKSKHHIFCKRWYKGNNTFVYVCQVCHDEFNNTFPTYDKDKWNKKLCLYYWVIFCSTKGKDAFVIYPNLENLKL